MSTGTRPSDKQLQARKAQSEADRKGEGKARAKKLQSEADSAAVTKHGD
ncbi:hypothetical protein ACFPPD_15825 [Cohnella suwonensis]|uniref:Small EDRK-rich factor-like N-terminal domain-containing protein n=1 Tax=Cohnella suwonensis TaxID=696072 RepID=A0ABW0M033_9BACL